MNEQFSKLLQECIVPANQAVEYSKSKGFVIPDEKLDVAKFAELIVRECLSICDEVQCQYGQYTFTATTVKDRVIQHFGVEE